MRDDGTRDGPYAHTPDGLSRRGWMVLVVVTTLVMVVFAGTAAIALALPPRHPPASSTSPAWAYEAKIPQVNPAPTTLGGHARPSPTPSATAPLRSVSDLTIGDCLQTYASKDEDAYPVVGCASPHIAQLLSKGELPQGRDTPFPGAATLDTQIGELCQQHLDWGWVGVWNEDVQLDLRYPDTDARWATGSRTYYCFVYTYSRHELTGSAVASP